MQIWMVQQAVPYRIDLGKEPEKIEKNEMSCILTRRMEAWLSLLYDYEKTDHGQNA